MIVLPVSTRGIRALLEMRLIDLPGFGLALLLFFGGFGFSLISLLSGTIDGGSYAKYCAHDGIACPGTSIVARAEQWWPTYRLGWYLAAPANGPRQKPDVTLTESP